VSAVRIRPGAPLNQGLMSFLMSLSFFESPASHQRHAFRYIINSNNEEKGLTPIGAWFRGVKAEYEINTI